MDHSMTVIILAAGFGKRTQGILKNTPKALIKTSDGKTILDHMVEDLFANCHFKTVYIVTNNRHYLIISNYVKKFVDIKIQVINDNRTTSEERMGSLGDLLFACKNIKDKRGDYLILPSDYAYWQAFSIKELIDFSDQYPRDFCLIGYDVEKKEIIKGRFGCIVLGSKDSVKKFIEKPTEPSSTIAASAFYLYRKSHINILERFIKEGNNGDQPGRFVPYLLKQNKTVRAFIVKYSLIDAGTPDDIERAKNY